MRRSVKQLITLGCCLILILSFQNCNGYLPYGQIDSSSISNGLSDGSELGNEVSKAIFAAEVHPIVRTNCGLCHGVSQQPLFAVSDIEASRRTMMELGLVDMNDAPNSVVINKILSGHQSIGSFIASDLLLALSDWADAYNDIGSVQPPNPMPPVTMPPVTMPPVVEPPKDPPKGLDPAVAYATTLYPVVVQACGGCHGGGRNPNFARSGNAQASYDVAMNFALINIDDPQNSIVVFQAQTNHKNTKSHEPALRKAAQDWADLVNGK